MQVIVALPTTTLRKSSTISYWLRRQRPTKRKQAIRRQPGRAGTHPLSRAISTIAPYGVTAVLLPSSRLLRHPLLIASSTRSTIKRTTLDVDSSLLYKNGLGGTSTSAISQAAVNRHTSAVPPSTTSAQEDFYKIFSMDQTKIERSILEREEQVTDSGLVASLKFFDDYNHREGRKSLREFLGQTWLRTLELSGFRGSPLRTSLMVRRILKTDSAFKGRPSSFLKLIYSVEFAPFLQHLFEVRASGIKCCIISTHYHIPQLR